MILIGIDDTDNLESRGTGNLARQIASELSHSTHVLGVTRHQLLIDPRIPYTKNNSSAAILLDTDTLPEWLLDRVRTILSSSIHPGSDPGLCLASQVPAEITAFGYRTKRELVSQSEARQLAKTHRVYLEGIAGDQGGVIGALAAVGLAASGEDGRYIHLGTIRELNGLQPVQQLLDAGVDAVKTMSGEKLNEGMIWIDKLRPARRGGKPVAFVEEHSSRWTVIKLD